MRRQTPASNAMSNPPILDEARAAFIQGGVAIAAASRDAANVPTAAHACGCRVSPDRKQVRVFVAAAAARGLIAAVRATRAIAVVFTEPATDHALQLKGSDAAIDAVTAEDAAGMPAYADAMVVQMAQCGFSEAFARTAWQFVPEQMVALTFTPAAAFVQTPGPRAGAPLEP